MIDTAAKQSFRLGALTPEPALRQRMPLLPGRLRANKSPDSLDRSRIAYSPIMGLNDQYGDCTAVGIANAALAKAALGGFRLPITDQQVLAFYARCLGIDPTNLPALAAAEGAYESDVLVVQAQAGFQTSDDLLVGAFGSLQDPLDFNSIRMLMVEWGSAYLGVSLSLADQACDVWTANPPASAGDPTPGSWGGHALLAWDYEGVEDSDIVHLVTWGSCGQRATWGWLRKACQEAHGILWRQLGLAALQDSEYQALLAAGQQVPMVINA